VFVGFVWVGQVSAGWAFWRVFEGFIQKKRDVAKFFVRVRRKGCILVTKFLFVIY